MLLGLGSGTTSKYFTEGVGRLVAEGMKLRCVPTSRATAEMAAELGIPILQDPIGPIDLAVDGADEVDPALNLIKGRGAALFREKLVAEASKRFIVIVDDSKLVKQLGVGELPVEVLPFLWRRTAERLTALGASLTVRGGEETPYITDNGNLILNLLVQRGIKDTATFTPSPTAAAFTSQLNCDKPVTATHGLALYEYAGASVLGILDVSDPLKPTLLCWLSGASGGRFDQAPNEIVFWIGNKLGAADLTSGKGVQTDTLPNTPTARSFHSDRTQLPHRTRDHSV